MRIEKTTRTTLRSTAGRRVDQTGVGVIRHLRGLRRKCWPAVIIVLAGMAQASPPGAELRGTVVDENESPAAGVKIDIESVQGRHRETCYTDVGGRFELLDLRAGEYSLTLNRAGFFRLTRRIEIKEGENEIQLVINHETEIHERLEVHATTEAVSPQDTSQQDSLVARQIRDIPVPATHDLKSSLPALPQVVRDNSGQLHIGGGRAGEAEFLLDGFDIGDPVSGDLTARVDVDSVRVAEADSGRYATQYGRAGTGVLALDTAVGDDRWRKTATNFIPSFNTQRGITLGNWYPRFTVSGPLLRDRAWISEAVSIQRNVHLFPELPSHSDTTTQWSGDNLFRAQVNVTPTNILQGAFLYNRQNGSNLGLGPFSPVETTTSLRSHRSFVSVKDQVWTKSAFYEVGVAFDSGRRESLPQGDQDYIVKPAGAAGNYFESLHERTRRWQFMADAAMPSRRWHGMHNLQFGLNASRQAWTHLSSRSSIGILRADDTLLERTAFTGPAAFHVSDTTVGAFAQDNWQVARFLVLQAGLREDWDRILHRATASTRVSANVLPFRDNRSKLTLGWGIFLQPLLLGTLGPAFDQSREDVFYDASGNTAVSGPITTRFVLPAGGLKQPSFYTTSIGWEQKIGKGSFAAVDFTDRNEHAGLAYEASPSNQTGWLFVLGNNRRDRYRSARFSVRHAFGDNAEISANYTRSSAHTNEVFDYSLGSLVFDRQQPGPLAWDAPNRFISSGFAPAPVWHLRLSYFLECRTGFPFNAINERQQVVGAANGLRFPDYASLNIGVEKQVRLFGREWAIRLTAVNVTGHRNFDFVNNNVDAPDYLTFAGGQDRAFSARIRLVK